MALLNDELSIWEIGFRWAGYDPARRWWHIPLPVRDNFRVLIDAIWNALLYCMTLSHEKAEDHVDIPKELFIRTHIDAIEDCVRGIRYAHLSSKHLAQYVDRFSPLRVVASEGATFQLRSAEGKGT